MMKFKSTFILAIVAVLAVALAIYKDKYDSAQSGSQSVLLEAFDKGKSDISFEDAISLGIEQRTDSFQVKKNGEKWELVSPVVDLGDEDSVSEYLGSLVRYKLELVETDGQDVNFDNFGLKDPRATITIGFANGKNRVLKVGHVRSYDQGYYFQIDDGANLYKGDNSFTSLLAKSSSNFRNKKLNIQPMRVEKISLSGKSQKPWQLIKKDGIWVSAHDPTILVDQEEVQKYLVSIQNLRATDFLANDHETKSLKANGLDLPDLKIALDYSSSDKGQGEELILLASQIGGDYGSLSSSNSSPIFKINIGDFNSMKRSFADLRDKKAPLKFDEAAVQEIEISKSDKNDRTVVTKNEKSWSIKDDPTKSVDSTAVEQMLQSMQQLRVSDYANRKPPEQKFTKGIKLLGADDKLLLQIDLLSVKNELYLAKSNLSDESFYISKDKVDDIMSKKLVLETKSP